MPPPVPPPVPPVLLLLWGGKSMFDPHAKNTRRSTQGTGSRPTSKWEHQGGGIYKYEAFEPLLLHDPLRVYEQEFLGDRVQLLAE